MIAKPQGTEALVGGGRSLEEQGILVRQEELDDPSCDRLKVADVCLDGSCLGCGSGLCRPEVQCTPSHVVQDEELQPSRSRCARCRRSNEKQAEEGPDVQASHGIVVVEVLGPAVAGMDLELSTILEVRVGQRDGDVLHVVGLALDDLDDTLLLFAQLGVFLVDVCVLVADTLHEEVVLLLSCSASDCEIVVC